jgi:hypothetical protein
VVALGVAALLLIRQSGVLAPGAKGLEVAAA